MSNFERRGRDIVSSSRELEKNRIREEILMAEFLRRQELEEEVMRELILEGKIAMQRPEKFLLGSEIRGPVLNRQDVLGLDSRLGVARARSSDGVVFKPVINLQRAEPVRLVSECTLILAFIGSLDFFFPNVLYVLTVGLNLIICI